MFYIKLYHTVGLLSTVWRIKTIKNTAEAVFLFIRPPPGGGSATAVEEPACTITKCSFYVSAFSTYSCKRTLTVLSIYLQTS